MRVCRSSLVVPFGQELGEPPTRRAQLHGGNSRSNAWVGEFRHGQARSTREETRQRTALSRNLRWWRDPDPEIGYTRRIRLHARSLTIHLRSEYSASHPAALG
jgi:hypothetical protein